MTLRDVRRIAVSEAGFQDVTRSIFQLEICHFIKFRVVFASPTWDVPVVHEAPRPKPNPITVQISEPFIAFPRDLD